MKVTGANLDNGMLHVDLVYEVAEAAKPRKIEIAYSPCSRRSRSRRRLLNNQRLLTGRPPIGGRFRFEAITSDERMVCSQHLRGRR
jgi:hypothetical protein